MKIAITGATGFVGKNLVPKLLSGGHEVMQFNSRNLDITKPMKLPEADVLFHLAANPKVYLARKQMKEDFEINSLGTINVLNAAITAKIPKIIYTSTVLVYENMNGAKEDDQVGSTAVSGPYGISKLTGEFYIKQYSYIHDIDYVILRPSGIYGPYMYKNPIIDMISGFIKNEQINLFHDINSEFDFIFVEDLANALISSIGWHAEVLNVSHGEKVRLTDVYEILCGIFGKKIPITYSGTKVTLEFKNERIKSLGWKEEYSLTEGLRKTIDFFLRRL